MKEQCLAAGMDGLAAKPVDIVALFAEIDRVAVAGTESGRQPSMDVGTAFSR